MRKEYDLSKGDRGKFYGKVDTKNVEVDSDDGTLDETFEDELLVLESNLDRIKHLRRRLSELDAPTRERFAQRISKACVTLEEIALSK